MYAFKKATDERILDERPHEQIRVAHRVAEQNRNWEVDVIVDSRIVGGVRIEYLVVWEPSWETSLGVETLMHMGHIPRKIQHPRKSAVRRNIWSHGI
jgi:hypothetical protein